MEIKKSFTAIKIEEYKKEISTFSYESKPDLSFGVISSLFSDSPIETSFDTEEEAIEYAYNTDKYVEWLIIPKISFIN